MLLMKNIFRMEHCLIRSTNKSEDRGAGGDARILLLKKIRQFKRMKI